MMEKYHIEKNSIQETLIIPLYARKICSDRFPDLFRDTEAERICGMLDYDFSAREKLMLSPAGLFGALEVAQRQYDLQCEVNTYLADHPEASVVNMGCGLDDTYRRVDNGKCLGFNIDFPDVIRIRDELLPAGERERNIACDLNDSSWMDEIPADNGAIFYAAGVFYYFETDNLKSMFNRMAQRFPGCVLVFDACNRRGASMMRKTWLKEAGITDVNAYFSLEHERELEDFGPQIHVDSSRSYMRGYRDIYSSVGFFHRIMIRFCDRIVRMRIIRIHFDKR